MSAQLIGKQNIGLSAQAGMATLEILIAFAISIMSIGAVVLLTFGNQSINARSQTHLEAVTLTKSILETSRARSRQDYNEIKDCDDSTAQKCPGPTDPFYNRKLSVTSETQCGKNITGDTSWNINDTTLNVTAITHLTDILVAMALGADCPSPTPFGDWASAQDLNSLDTTPATLKATGLDIKNKIVYMSTDPSAASDPDFYIFDTGNVSETSAPALIASINTGPGIASVDAAQSYAYIANDSKNGQLQIIDVSNINNPILKTTFNVIPGGTDINTVGTKVFYYDSTVYLGLKKNNYAEFYIINVSNIFSPIIKGSYELNASVNSISVQGDYAYVATPNSEEITVIDINENSSKYMQRVGGFDAPGGSGNGKSIRIIGNKLYFGRTVGNIEFYILDVSDPKNLSILGSNNVNSSINDLVVAGDYAYLATGEAGSEFQILDVSNPANPTLLGKFDFTDKPTGIDYENNLIYISNENSDALIIISPKT